MRVNILKSKVIPTLKDGWHTDGNGLYLHIRKDTRNWVVRCSVNSKRLSTTIGSYPSMSLAEARACISEAKSRLSDSAYGFESTKTPFSVRKVAEEALESTAVVKQWTNDKHKKQWLSTLEAYVFPTIGDRLISTITIRDIKLVLEPIWFTKTETARRLRGRLRHIFAYAILMGYYDKPNPAEWDGCLSHLLPSPDKVRTIEHHSAASADAVPELIKTLYTTAPRKDVYLAVIFGTLTATRAQEFSKAMWDEFDFENNVWTIPPARVKSKDKDTPIRVPITKQMRHVLLLLKRKNKDYVFGTSHKKQLSPDAPLLALRELGYDFTMHGMRSTFSDWAIENGENPVYVEKALNHVIGNKVQQAYQRSDCLEQRRPLMERWNDYCFKLATGGL